MDSKVVVDIWSEIVLSFGVNIECHLRQSMKNCHYSEIKETREAIFSEIMTNDLIINIVEKCEEAYKENSTFDVGHICTKIFYDCELLKKSKIFVELQADYDSKQAAQREEYLATLSPEQREVEEMVSKLRTMGYLVYPNDPDDWGNE